MRPYGHTCIAVHVRHGQKWSDGSMLHIRLLISGGDGFIRCPQRGFYLGGIASAFIYTAFSTGPSAGAVKAVQLVDVILAWGVSHRLFKERIKLVEALGIVLVLAGAITVVL